MAILDQIEKIFEAARLDDYRAARSVSFPPPPKAASAGGLNTRQVENLRARSRRALMAHARRENCTLPDGRPVKITLGETRATGGRGLIVFCADYKCSHNITPPPAYVDRWPDHIRLSDLEPRFVCKACGQRGANIRGESQPTMKNAFPDHNRTR